MEKSSSDDPGNFSAMKDEISLIAGRLREDLKKIKAGGLDVDAIESLRVRLKDSSGGVTGGGKGVKGAKSKGSGGEDVRLGDVAQVIPRGRVVVVSVGEKDVSHLFYFQTERYISFGVFLFLCLGANTNDPFSISNQSRRPCLPLPLAAPIILLVLLSLYLYLLLPIIP